MTVHTKASSCWWFLSKTINRNKHNLSTRNGWLFEYECHITRNIIKAHLLPSWFRVLMDQISTSQMPVWHVILNGQSIWRRLVSLFFGVTSSETRSCYIVLQGYPTPLYYLHISGRSNHRSHLSLCVKDCFHLSGCLIMPSWIQHGT